MRIPSLFLAVLMLAAPAARADYYVVVSERNPVTMLSQKEALQIFMGRSRNFPDGRTATACDIGDEALRAGFYRSLGGMSLPQVNSYWARLMFSGRSLPPQRMESESAMVERIGSDPTAIGWLPQAPRQKGLRTVLVLPEVP
ncbi:MAG TPA: hypothetical protein VN645_04775 [Steroidobacteraceae bacterium]|nr:hypothetical protein [Steroidobacteraceae bacterium]